LFSGLVIGPGPEHILLETEFQLCMVPRNKILDKSCKIQIRHDNFLEIVKHVGAACPESCSSKQELYRVPVLVGKVQHPRRNYQGLIGLLGTCGQEYRAWGCDF